MSTASLVPETWELTGDDAKETLERTDRTQLMKDAMVRLRSSDGFSNARSMAFLSILVFVQGVIGVVGIATALGSGWLSDAIVKVLQSIVPGSAGRTLTQAVEQAHRAGSSGKWVAIAVGTIGAVVSGTTLMGQIERALNRLYGIEKDRSTLRKYGRALLLTFTAGVLAVLAFGALALGGAIADSLGGGLASTILNVVRWPFGITLLVVATALIMRWAPRRRMPAWSWLVFGSFVGVGLMALVTLAVNLFLQFNSAFGATYGPLAGIIALAFWAYFSAVALLAGAALSAQLEAVRAGVTTPQSARKVVESEPWQTAGAGRRAGLQAS